MKIFSKSNEQITQKWKQQLRENSINDIIWDISKFKNEQFLSFSRNLNWNKKKWLIYVRIFLSQNQNRVK